MFGCPPPPLAGGGGAAPPQVRTTAYATSSDTRFVSIGRSSVAMGCSKDPHPLDDRRQRSIGVSPQGADCVSPTCCECAITGARGQFCPQRHRADCATNLLRLFEQKRSQRGQGL